jgi:hypothetical protein
MGNEVFVASREKPKNGYGQNGYQGPASDLPRQKTKTAVSDVAPSQVAVPALRHEDTMQARVKMDGDKAAAYPRHDGMPPRDSNSGSPGGKVPGSLSYGREGKR